MWRHPALPRPRPGWLLFAFAIASAGGLSGEESTFQPDFKFVPVANNLCTANDSKTGPTFYQEGEALHVKFESFSVLTNQNRVPKGSFLDLSLAGSPDVLSFSCGDTEYQDSCPVQSSEKLPLSETSIAKLIRGMIVGRAVAIIRRPNLPPCVFGVRFGSDSVTSVQLVPFPVRGPRPLSVPVSHHYCVEHFQLDWSGPGEPEEITVQSGSLECNYKHKPSTTEPLRFKLATQRTLDHGTLHQPSNLTKFTTLLNGQSSNQLKEE